MSGPLTLERVPKVVTWSEVCGGKEGCRLNVLGRAAGRPADNEPKFEGRKTFTGRPTDFVVWQEIAGRNYHFVCPFGRVAVHIFHIFPTSPQYLKDVFLGYTVNDC